MDMFLPAFPSRTNLKLLSTFVSPKMIKISHNGSWTSLVDPVFILFQWRFSRIYQLIFPIYVWKNFGFQIVWKSHKWSLSSKIAQDHCPVFFLLIVIPVISFYIIALLSTLKNVVLFSWFSVTFHSPGGL